MNLSLPQYLIQGILTPRKNRASISTPKLVVSIRLSFHPPASGVLRKTLDEYEALKLDHEKLSVVGAEGRWAEVLCFFPLPVRATRLWR